MGTGATLPDGNPAPDPTVYDIDGFSNPASTVAALHARGAHVLCYIEVGALESGRPDSGSFPGADLGATVPGYSDEHYLNIRDPVVETAVEARIAMCAAKGFDAIEPDIDDSYTNNTGFALSKGDEEAYVRTLAGYAHGLHLAWGLKNGDAADGFAADVFPTTDFVLDEQCNEYGNCAALAPYSGRKAVFEVEYNLPTASFCPGDNSRGWDGVALNVQLAGGRQPCR